MTARREAPLSVLKDLAEAVDVWLHCNPKLMTSVCTKEALAAYRAATAPLRSSRERNDDIAEIVLGYFRTVTRPGCNELPDWDLLSTGQKNDLNRLCSEPTSDPNPSGPGGDEQWCRSCPHCAARED